MKKSPEKTVPSNNETVIDEIDNKKEPPRELGVFEEKIFNRGSYEMMVTVNRGKRKRQMTIQLTLKYKEPHSTYYPQSRVAKMTRFAKGNTNINPGLP
jgi:hypothetical protein